MKENRHSRILDIISRFPVETQEDLMLLLQREGYSITQATVSRDIRELQLIKTLNENGRYCYSVPKKEVSGGHHIYYSALESSVVSVEAAQNIIVLKTFAGMAQTVAVAVDSLNDANILGCVGGDDTVIVVARTNDQAIELATRFKSNLK